MKSLDLTLNRHGAALGRSPVRSNNHDRTAIAFDSTNGQGSKAVSYGWLVPITS
ncbi:hypothetical protein ACFL1R_01830 [Candidatus Latescibacterota bacterium]